MKIEIWSDIMCPFCYIGKRHLETALARFPEAGVQIVWKSYQLDPFTVPQPNKNVYQYLAERKGISLEESVAIHQSVVERAAEVGLEYNFEISKVANSLTAHRLIQLAKRNGLGNEIEERFFQAYFTEGCDMNDPETLMRLCIETGLNALDIRDVLADKGLYLGDVQADIREAQEIGVRGVPFFVFNRKYAVSGAQPVEYFIQTIQTVLAEEAE